MARVTRVTMIVAESAELDPETRTALRGLWDAAFGDGFSDDDVDHAYGGVHVLLYDGHRVVAHASAVPRQIRFGDGPWLGVGYVEAVATLSGYQRRGLGTQVMTGLQSEIGRRWPVAMLSTGRTEFYQKLGWERWQGLSYTATGATVVADDEHSGLMILRLDRAVVPDLSVEVTCEDRPGDAW